MDSIKKLKTNNIRWMIGTKKKGNLFRDKRTYKHKGTAERIALDQQQFVKDKLIVMPVSELTDKEKIKNLEEKIKKLEEKITVRDSLLEEYDEVVLMYMRRFNGTSMVRFEGNKPVLDSDEVRKKFEKIKEEAKCKIKITHPWTKI